MEQTRGWDHRAPNLSLELDRPSRDASLASRTSAHDPPPPAQARQTPEKGHGPKDPEEGEGFVCDGKAHGRSLALQEKEVGRKGDGARARAGVVRAAPA